MSRWRVESMLYNGLALQQTCYTLTFKESTGTGSSPSPHSSDFVHYFKICFKFYFIEEIIFIYNSIGNQSHPYKPNRMDELASN